MRKLGVLLVVVLFLFSFGYDVFSVTDTNKNITVRVIGTWDPFSMGWEPDELLISPTNVLNKPYGAIVDQNDLTNNGGRMLTYFDIPYRNTCEPTNDSVYPGRDTDTLTKGEATELWLTWDTNALYIAVRGQTAGQRNNIMIYFDREPNVGKVAFDRGVVWNRRVYFYNMDPDMYIGFWCKDGTPYFDYSGSDSGGVQIYSHTGPDGSIKVGISSYRDTGNVPGSPNMNTSIFDFWYNGSSEPDMFKRVAIAKIAWSFFFTNVNPTNMWLKVAVATTGPGYGDYGIFNFDYLPDPSINVESGKDTAEDNFIMIRVTDGNANPIIGVNVRNSAYVNFYPGIQLKPKTAIDFYMKVSGVSSSGIEDFSPKVFAPSRGDKLKIRIPVDSAISSIVEGTIKIYDMKGNVVRNLVSKFDFTPVILTYGDRNTALNSGNIIISDPNAYEFPYTFVWDGTDDRGKKVPMGNYLVVVQGRSISGAKLSGVKYCSVIY